MAIDRRRAPRFTKLLWLDIAGLEARTANVSESGLQLVLNADWWARLQDRLLEDRLVAQIELPGGLTIEAQCRVVYVSECGDECLVGVRIVHMPREDMRLWSNFVAAGGGAPSLPAAAFAAP